MADKTSIEAVVDLLPQLSAQQQREVRDFAEFLLWKTICQHEQDDSSWTAFSLQSALRGMEDEGALYDEEDLQERWFPKVAS